MADGATFDEMTKLGWATELTLKRLAASSESSNNLIGLIAKRYRIDPAAIAKAVNDGSSKSSTSTEKAIDAASDKAKDDQKKLQGVIKSLQGSLIANLTGLFSQTNISGVFGSFGTSLKAHSVAAENASNELKSLAASAKIAGTVISILALFSHRLDDVSNAMTLVYANGIKFDTGLAGLVQSASDAGMHVSEFAGLLSKYGALSASLGTRSVMALSKQFQTATHSGGDLMMSQKEASEAFFDTLEMMRGSGELLGLNDEQRAARGNYYLKNLNELALETGRNRDELRKTTVELMKKPFQFLWAKQLGTGGAGKLTEFMAQLSSQFGQMADPVASMIEQVKSAGGGFGLLDQKMIPLLSFAPELGAALQASAAAVNGTDEDRAIAAKRMSDAFDNISAANMIAMRRSYPELAAWTLQVQQSTMQVKAQKIQKDESDQADADRRGITKDQLLAEQKATQDRMKVIKGTFNESNAALARLSNSVSLIATRFDGVLIPAIKVLTAGIDGLAWVFERIADTAGPLGDWASSIIDNFKPLFKIIYDSLEAPVKYVGKLFSDIGTGLSKFISRLSIWSNTTDPNKPTTGVGAVVGAEVGMLQIVGTGAAAMVIYKILGSITKVFAGSGSSLLGKLIGSAVKFSGLGSIMKGIGGLGTGLAKGVGSIFEMVGTVIKSGATAIASVIEGLGNILGSVGKAIGKGVGGILEGLSGGLTKLGNPTALLGAGVLAALAGTVWLLGNGLKAFNDVAWESMGKAAVAIVALALAGALAGNPAVAGSMTVGAAAIAFTIGAIGLAISGASWIMGNTLPLLSEGLKSFADIDGDALSKAGLGMKALAGGLIALTGAEVVSGLGGLVTGLTSMFLADPVSKLKAFSSVADPLMKTAEALKLIAEVMPKAIEAINNLGTIDLTGFGKLRQLLSLTQNVPGGLIANLADVFSSPRVVQGLRDLTQQAAAQRQTGGVTGNTPATPGISQPVITMDEINTKTLEYYEKTVKQFQKMIDLMQNTLDVSNDANNANKRGLDNISSAVLQISGRV